MYLVDWVQEWFKLDTILSYVGLGLLCLYLIILIIAFVMWMKER